MERYIFIDVDGTLRNSKRELEERTIESVKKAVANGFNIVLCSGRPRKYTAEISEICGASKYVITSNGGNIYNYETNETVYSNNMNKEACKELYSIAKENCTKFVMNVGETLEGKEQEQYISLKDDKYKDISEFLRCNEIVQITISEYDFDKIKNLEPIISKVKNVEIKNKHKSLSYEDFPKTGNIYYDIACNDTSKGRAVKKLAEKLKINLDEAIAIGDSINDLSMFSVVGKSVAMGNAKDDIKSFADEVTLSNDEFGLAVYLDKLVEENKKTSCFI